jgi:uncharacterized membrane protein
VGPGEDLIGARVYRVIFAAISLPLAVAAVVYFINHRYDGLPLWNLRRFPGMHEFVWGLNFISFFFLYPSTFNLLEVRIHNTNIQVTFRESRLASASPRACKMFLLSHNKQHVGSQRMLHLSGAFL